jgi:hypothetical protein
MPVNRSFVFQRFFETGRFDVQQVFENGIVVIDLSFGNAEVSFAPSCASNVFSLTRRFQVEDLSVKGSGISKVEQLKRLLKRG